MLTDVADSRQLGTRERRRAKERKIQATRTVEATGDGTATEGGIDESGKFLQDIQESVSNGETVDRKLAHSMFVGPNGSGKSSLMDRLLKRPRKELSLSTGVCSPVVMVDIDVDNPSTFHSVNVIDSNTWEEVEYDISLVRQMNKESVTTAPPEQVQPISSEEIAIPPAEIASPPTPPTASSVLNSLIVKSGFRDLVQYADAGKGQVMFAVDNTSESDEDFKAIRSKVHSLISGRKEFTIEYPIAYLLFCLELQNLKRSILTLDECKVMAAKYGIEGDQVSHLLQFLHLRIGVIQYHDVEGLRHIVIKEPQLLFKKVTNLIIRTFSCEALTTKEQQDFRKGILASSVLDSIISRDDEITSEDFLKLLVHLRIITPHPSATPADQEKRYFIPCVLNHVEESSEESLHTDILPLSVQFQCLHCPKGLFGVLVTHLMTPEPVVEADSSHMTSFTLIEEKIFKDQVSFEVHSHSDQDELSLRVLPSHIEITYFPSLDEERVLAVGEVCSNVRQVIETSILRSLEDLHYNKCKVKPAMCLRCENCSELHPVKKGDPCKMYCKKGHKNARIPSQGRCWFNEGKTGCVCWCGYILIVPILHAESESATAPPTSSHIGPAELPGSGK